MARACADGTMSLCLLRAVAQLDGEEGEDQQLGDEDDGEEHKESDSRSRKKQRTKEASREPDVSTYTGIDIRVAFGGAASHSHQLSGGQQSMVALCLIFAIQRCDPSPFYLMDEIDSAL